MTSALGIQTSKVLAKLTQQILSLSTSENN